MTLTGNLLLTYYSKYGKVLVNKDGDFYICRNT